MKKLELREEVAIYGGDRMDDQVLFQILTSIKKELIAELFYKYGSLEVILDNGSSIADITEVQRAKIHALRELRLRRNGKKGDRITSPRMIADTYMDEYRGLEVEHFDVLLLNTKNVVIEKVNIGKGTVNAALVHPREVFKEAIRKSANSIILLHNHPSGYSWPSDEDRKITDRLVETGNVVGIRVLDHIVIGDNEYTSFKEDKLLLEKKR